MLFFQLKSISMCGCPYELQSTGSVPSLNECSIYAQTRVFHLSLFFFICAAFPFDVAIKSSVVSSSFLYSLQTGFSFIICIQLAVERRVV